MVGNTIKSTHRSMISPKREMPGAISCIGLAVSTVVDTIAMYLPADATQCA